ANLHGFSRDAAARKIDRAFVAKPPPSEDEAHARARILSIDLRETQRDVVEAIAIDIADAAPRERSRRWLGRREEKGRARRLASEIDRRRPAFSEDDEPAAADRAGDARRGGIDRHDDVGVTVAIDIAGVRDVTAEAIRDLETARDDGDAARRHVDWIEVDIPQSRGAARD